MKSALFSVVTINRNNLLGLQKTWQSLRAQTYFSWRWIVVDGASTDGAADWLRNLQDERILWLSEKDGGIYDAMNKGIGLVNGVYIHFLNSGDVFANETVLEKIAQHPRVSAQSALLLYGDTLECLLSGEIHYKKARNHQGYVKGMFASHQSMLFHSQLFVTGLRYDTRWKLSADYGLVCQILQSLPNDDALYFDFPIAKFFIGGAHYTNRLTGLFESGQIQKEIVGTPFPMRSLLFISQILWHGIKLFLPWRLHLLARKLFFRREISR